MRWFVSRKTYEDLALDSECKIACLAKQNQALYERIRAGEDYRRELEHKVELYRIDNGTLYATREADRRALAEANKTVKELRLRLGSMEAQWCQRGEHNDSV